MKLAILGAYIVVLLVLGWIGMKKTKTLNDFFLGGRKIGPFMSAFAYASTYFSAVVFIGYAGKIGWGFGLSSLWISVGNAILGCLIAWKFLARPTRAMSIRIGSITMPGFFARRYNSVAMEIFAALIIFVFLVPYCSSVYSGLSYIFEAVFNLDYTVSLVIIAVVTAVYLVMGGYSALNLADVFQGFIMVFGVIFMVILVVSTDAVGGFGQIIPRLKSIDPALIAPVGPGGFIPLLALVLLTSLAPWAMPQMVQKFYAVKSEKVIKTATWGTFILGLLISFGAYFTGSISRLFFTDLAQVGGNVDRIIPTILQIALPEFMQALILVLVLSASMSTLASLVLVASSSVAVNIVDTLWPGVKNKKMVLFMRVLCILFVAISLYNALNPGVIVNVMALSWGAIAGSFLAPYLFGLFYRKTTKAGAWSAMLTGLTIAVVGSLMYPDSTPVVGSIAMLVPLIVVPVVSAFTKPYSKEHLEFVFDSDGHGQEGDYIYIWEGLKKKAN